MMEFDKVAAAIRRDKEIVEDSILKELLYIKDRINKSSEILTDLARTAFFFVLTPAEMVVNDTVKAAELFSKFQVPLSGYVLNRIIPPELTGRDAPPYLKNRVAAQGKALALIEERFGGQVLASVPEMERDITGLEMIEKVAKSLFSDL